MVAPRIMVGLAVGGLVAGFVACRASDAALDETDDAVDLPLSADDELAAEASDRAARAASANGPPDTAIAWGTTDTAELRKFLPIGRSPDTNRYVVMRLRPSDLPRLALGDTLRAASEIQVTTRCDIGQTGPGCGYAPHVKMQLLLSGNPDATDAKGPGTVALSDVKEFDCTSNDHHCVKVIDFTEAAATLRAGSAPPCVAADACFVDFVMWAYHPDARGGGEDELLLGANEGDFLQNGDIEQDRGRVMAVRERNVTPADVSLRVTSHTVRRGSMQLASNGHEEPIYSAAVNGGADLEAGQKFRVWTDVEASSTHRVDLSLEMFLTKNRGDGNGGSVDGTSPQAISEHNGTNCSPGEDCHVRKIAVFQVDRDVKGPVYVNVAASTEVPGPGSATTTIHDTGFVKIVRYAK